MCRSSGHEIFSCTVNARAECGFCRASHATSCRRWFWVVEVEGLFAGFTGLARANFATTFTPCVEVGWRLAQWAWGKGYASEAAKESLRLGFEEHAFSEIFSFTTETNMPSESVMKRIGMKRRGDLDFGHPNTPGWWGQSHIVYSIDQATWAEYGG